MRLLPADCDSRKLLLEDAALKAFASKCAVKYYVAHLLVQTVEGGLYRRVPLSLKDAAQAARVGPSTLLYTLKADPRFEVTQSADGSYSLLLNTAKLLKKAGYGKKKYMKAEELAPPAGWTDGIHPHRPGAWEA